MFPNPQAALPLPLRPNLERYKKLAKDLVKACRSGDSDAIGDWADKWVNALVKSSGIKLTRQLPVAVGNWADQVEEFAQRKLSGDAASGSTKAGETGPPQSGRCRLAEAQFVIARSHGFESWPRFIKHIEGLTNKSSAVARFEAAADAIIKGEITTLKRLLREDPSLISRR